MLTLNCDTKRRLHKTRDVTTTLMTSYVCDVVAKMLIKTLGVSPFAYKMSLVESILMKFADNMLRYSGHVAIYMLARIVQITHKHWHFTAKIIVS